MTDSADARLTNTQIDLMTALHRRIDGHHDDIVTLKVQHQYIEDHLTRLDVFLRDHMASEEKNMVLMNDRIGSIEKKINRIAYMIAGAGAVFTTMIPAILWLSKVGIL